MAATGGRQAGHIVLLGDSIFDNKAYVAGGPDVVTQLRGDLPPGWRASLAAMDGAVAAGVNQQLPRLPAGATHLVISAGGNDALWHERVLGERVGSVGEALVRLAAVQTEFQRSYREMLDAVVGRGLPTTVCTIYDPRFPDLVRRKIGTTGLALFNDVITREAFARGLPVIDLRLVCNEDGDFANPIEPSVQGGGKIAAEIARLVLEHEFGRSRSAVFVGRSR
ncbi:SGNH/GDSL hydrolase family protein [Roseomonas sp. E05]|uniref:SGNH/GDSL hydrolase family protein n=1 Tax=Roseomonas sp. E05 TaxID=3046310 RepID=UPI0024B99ED0|nr:SGNH/GDSL hydrolase family protein [Roseomonas sp. E05]MDJ0387324.1 SGNH/GDSL hydrolase family protein [Roseomonas sp. E05]